MGGRSEQKEWMDFGLEFCSIETYHDCLKKLDRIGRFLGGDHATFKAFASLKKPPRTILDVGCGGGLFTLRLAAKYPQARVIGIDLSKEAIQFAQEQSKKFPQIQNIQFMTASSPQLSYADNSFDVVTTTLVCHHLNDCELISFLKDAYRIANKAVIFNDLHRHFAAQFGFALTVPFLFPNRMIFHDGLISIKRAFKRQDWEHYFEKAQLPRERCTLTWNWAFRWIATICKDHNA